MTLRVVLDTNVVVSALLKPSGLENYVLRLGLGGAVKLCTSPAVFAEYTSVLARPRLKLKTEEIRIILEQLRKESKSVHTSQTLTVSTDEPDNRFLECAEGARADFLITGNKRHFPEQWKDTRIVTSREFLNEIIS
jgi:putative PIN family toxin of toxin-antitoxin system